MRLSSLWLFAACVTTPPPCATQLDPAMRGYVCKAGLSTDLATTADTCLVPACEAVIHDDPGAYLKLVRGATQPDAMTERVLGSADDALFVRYLDALNQPYAQDPYATFLGFARAGAERDGRTAWARTLAGITSANESQSPGKLREHLQAIAVLDERASLVAALAIAFDPKFGLDARRAATDHLVAASQSSKFPLVATDYDLARRLYTARKAAADATPRYGDADDLAQMTDALNTARPQ